MSFFTFESIARAVNGRWVQRPDDASWSRALDGVGIDTRADLSNRAYFAIHGANHDGHAFLEQAVQGGARLLIVEKSSALKNVKSSIGVVQVTSTRKALGQLAQHYRRSFASPGGTKVIAITGSAGKTTTKRLLHVVLSQVMKGCAAPHSFNNEIGVPLTLLSAKPRDQYVVVEVGTNAPGEIHQLGQIAAPDLAIITSIGRSHLEKLGSLEGVAKEKASLLSHVSCEGDGAIINADEPLLRPYAGLVKPTVLFGEAEDGDLRMSGFGFSGDRCWFEVNERSRFVLRLFGKHNAMNALAVVAAARRFGLDDAAIQRGFDEAEPEAMRAEWNCVGTIDLFNDAYNANPESVRASLETFAQLAAASPRRIIVLGDMLELGEEAPALHHEVAQRIIEMDRQCPIEHVVLIGSLVESMTTTLAAAWGHDRVTHAASLSQQTIDEVLDLLRPGDAVLLKGSRGMALERIVEHLAATSGLWTARARV